MHLMAEGLMFPEGPIAMEDGSVILVEMSRETLSRVSPKGQVSVIAELGGGPNGAALGPDGKVYVCNNGGFDWIRRSGRPKASGKLSPSYAGGRIEVVDPETGRFERLYDSCDGNQLRGPNDIVFDPEDGFWFTDTGKVQPRSQDKGGIYWAKTDGSEIREVAYGLLAPNGIGISPDGKVLYVSETPTSRLWAWEILGPGQLRKLRGTVAHGGRFIWGASNYQRFDSLALTASGQICVATLNNGGITEIHPDGSSFRHHPLPDVDVTNVCFGGSDLRTAFVTLSHHGALAAVDWHEPGLRLKY